MKDQKEKLKEKKQKAQEKRHKNNENFNEVEADNDRKRSEFKKKLESFEIRKKEVTDKQMMKIREIMKKEKQNYLKTLERRKEFDEHKSAFNDNILKYQNTVINRSDLKESSAELSKVSA